jgi:peptidoglycan/LPS O-acetylase OafA/YrhL
MPAWPAKAGQPRVVGTARSARRLDSLTGMRFFAAMAVVLIHVGAQFARRPWLITAESFGYIGVSFFFLLSGFVLTWSSTQQPAKRFWWLRFGRIWPATTMMAIFAFTVVAGSEQIPGRLGKAAETLLLQAWWPDQKVYYGGNGVSWSLSAEMFFYLLFPIVIIPLRRLSSRGLLVTAVATVAILYLLPVLAASAGMSPATYSYVFFVFPPYRFGEFLLGMLLARGVHLGLRVPAPAWSWCAGAFGLGCIVWGLTYSTRASGVALQRPFVALAVLPCFALMLAAGASRDVRGTWWLGSRPLLRLGEWSFALYLVHKPAFLLTNQWGWWGAPRGVASLVAFLVYIGLTVAVAAVLHYLVEKPIERALRRLPIGQHHRDETSSPVPAVEVRWRLVEHPTSGRRLRVARVFAHPPVGAADPGANVHTFANRPRVTVGASSECRPTTSSRLDVRG